jgi:DNA repair exonuclease SbcCD nuclease subunit
LAELLRVAYGTNGRVNVLNNDSVFIAYRMGNTLVLIHHSDQCRPQNLAGVMTTDFRQDYGETEFHYIDIGHIHHKMVAKEHPGIVVESFNILAAPDKYAHDHGYRSRQCITVVYRSRTYGEVGRRVLGIKEVRDKLSMAMPAARRAFAA